MKWDSIEKLVALMNENDLEEVEFEDEKIRVRFKKAGMVAQAPVAMAAPVAIAAAATSAASAAPVQEESKGSKVTSPFVGTFYRSPSPTDPPFAEVGQTVKKGDTLCIIEAMKLMNEIESEYNGKIVEILVENGKPVEFGQPLFVIEPS